MMKCPKCKKSELYLNTTGYSKNYYSCNSRWKAGHGCDFAMPVNEYEVTYQGDIPRIQRIRNKFNIGLMERNDFEYLLQIAESKEDSL